MASSEGSSETWGVSSGEGSSDGSGARSTIWPLAQLTPDTPFPANVAIVLDGSPTRLIAWISQLKPPDRPVTMAWPSGDQSMAVPLSISDWVDPPGPTMRIWPLSPR